MDPLGFTPSPGAEGKWKNLVASSGQPIDFLPWLWEDVTMKGDILLSQKEARRSYIIEEAVAGRLTVRQAAELLNLSTRQVKRLKRGVRSQGMAFLAHKNRGRSPKHTIPKEVKDLIVALALDPDKYKDASCEQMAELLASRQSINVSPRSIRRILSAAGITLAHAHKPARRHKSRGRLPSFGLLLQCDASPCAWFESRGPQATLHGAIDDATSRVVGLFFRPTEDTIGYLHVLYQIVTNHGIPQAFYTDHHTLFLSPKTGKLSVEEELAGKVVPLTQFGRAISELGIGHVAAGSPQAKGRVERLWQTLQGRLLIELRLAGISTIDEANAFLPDFITRFNERFAVEPANPESAFTPCPPLETLNQIICLKESRKASSGSTIAFSHRTYQLVSETGSVCPLRPKNTVYILTHLDGSQSALYEGKGYQLKECPSTKSQKPQDSSESEPVTHTSHKPAADHPWRQDSLPKRDPNSIPSDEEKRFWRSIYAQR